MTEIREALAILKARWREVAVIVGLPLLAQFLQIIMAHRAIWLALNPTIFIWPYIFINSILFPIILIVFKCGFLRTAYLQNQKLHSLLVLVRVGVHFLWRMVILGLLYGLPSLLLVLLELSIIYKHWPFEYLSQTSAWFNSIVYIAFRIIFAKLILLTPAIVIAIDCGAFESFKFLKFCKLSKAKTLVVLYCISIALCFLPFILSQYCYGGTCCTVVTTSLYLFRFIHSVIMNLINLVIAVMAVRFVGQSPCIPKTPLDIEAEQL